MADRAFSENKLDAIAEQMFGRIGERSIDLDFSAITVEELHKARLSPREIVPDFLYADVRTRIAAGGTGKTTLVLYEAIQLSIGRSLWGRMPTRSCRTVVVTREDTRETLVARMREMMAAMSLSIDDINTVISNVLILDLSDVSFRLSTIVGDVVEPHTINIETLARRLKDWSTDWLIFDPLVSFGVGESRVNDAEQGLIEAFRMFRNRLDCCVEGVHHSGKANAREKNLDQYAGRGGSALSDGSRMVVVMQPLTPDEWKSETGTALAQFEEGIVMALPKLSYTKKQNPIFIKRSGFSFSMVQVSKKTSEQVARSIEEQVYQFIFNEYQAERRYSTQDLENSKAKLKLTRAEIRSALTALKVDGRIVYIEIKGKPGSHFEPLTIAEDIGDTGHDLSAPWCGDE